MNRDIIVYYKERAKEYESIYLKPERQEDLKTTTVLLQNLFAKQSVFEIACGTGFWTEKIAETATSIFATDINQAVIDIAKQKQYSKKNVSFELADIFELSIKNKYQSLFGGIIWSHIKLQELDKFLAALHHSVLPGGRVVFMDNKYVEGSNLPMTNTDQEGNTFQTRTLADGTSHLVLKNFPTEAFLRVKLADKASDLEFIHLKYFWLMTYKTRVE